MATNCEDVSAQMMDLLYGELPADARANVDAHVAGCVRCRAELDGFEKTRAVARQALDVDEEPPASARAAIMKAAAAHLAAQAQPAAAARKAVPPEKASFWDRLRAAWAFPTLATVGAVAVFLVASRVFLNPERALDRPQVATQEAPAPAAPPLEGSERQGWEGKPPTPGDSQAKDGHRSRLHAHGRSGKSGEVAEAALPREPEPSTTAGRADDPFAARAGAGEVGDLREGVKKKRAEKAERFAAPPPAKPAPAEEKAYEQPLAKQKFTPPPPPRDAPAAKLKEADKAPAKAPAQAQAQTLDNLLDEAEKPRGGGGKASNNVVGGLGGPGNKADGYGSGAGAATRAPAAPRPTVSATNRPAPAPVAETAAAAPAMAPAMAPAPPPPPPAAPKTRAKKSNVAAGDDADFAQSESAAKDEKKVAGRNTAAETLMQRADRFFAEGRWAEAAAIYRELLRRDPRGEDAERWRRRLVAAENAEVNERRNANVAAKRAAEGYEKGDAERAAPPAARKSAKPAAKASTSESQ